VVVHAFNTGSAQSRHHAGQRGDGVCQALTSVSGKPARQDSGLPPRPTTPPRGTHPPQRIRSQAVVIPALMRSISCSRHAVAATAGALPPCVPSARGQRNSVPSTHIRCSAIASLRATATIARLCPRRLASPAPQARRTDHFLLRTIQGVRRLVERSAHLGVPTACDTAIVVDGAGLEPFGRAPEVCAHGA